MRSHQLFCALLPALILAMCQAESHSARLTAFGKTPNQNSHAHSNKHTLGRTRECKSDGECAGIQNTTCMSDPRDNKMRCLCRDTSAPINGACPNLPRALKATCTANSECVEGSECKTMANSTTPGINLPKMCLCKEGYVEQDGWCNSGFSLQFPSLVTLITASIIIVHATHLRLQF